MSKKRILTGKIHLGGNIYSLRWFFEKNYVTQYRYLVLKNYICTAKFVNWEAESFSLMIKLKKLEIRDHKRYNLALINTFNYLAMIHNHKKYDLTLNLTTTSPYQPPPPIQHPLDHLK